MLAAERELGPRWTPKELQMFYILLRALDVTTSSSSSTASVQWTKLERKLPARTPAMICALFGMHREYLSRPEASVEGFCAIMADYYKAVDEELRSGASSGPIRANAAASPDADIKMEVVEDEPSHSSDHEMDAATRIRKRENSLTPASTAADNANALSMLPSASAFSSATVKTEKKKRKLERILAWEAAGDQLELQAQLQLQIRSDEDETAVVCGVMRSSASSSTPASKVLLGPPSCASSSKNLLLISVLFASIIDSPRPVDRARGCKIRRLPDCSLAKSSSYRGSTGSTRSWTATSSVTTSSSTVSTAWGSETYVVCAVAYK